jgi:hypothetical protein
LRRLRPLNAKPTHPLKAKNTARPSRFESTGPSGKVFVHAALLDARARVARGERVRFVFDIDNTLMDTRHRTLAIARDFDARNGTSHFKQLTVDKIGLDARATCARLGCDAKTSEAFHRYWEVEFWNARNFVHDQPMPEIVRLAKAAHQAGAEVVYLTGRNSGLTDTSVAQLKRAGLPNADAEHLFSKPMGTYTPAYKAEKMTEWQSQGIHIGFFITEGRRDIAHVQQVAPSVPTLLLDSTVGGTERIAARTPVYPLQF